MNFKERIRNVNSQNESWKLNEIIRSAQKDVTEQDMKWSKDTTDTVLRYIEKTLMQDHEKNIAIIMKEISDDVEQYVSSFYEITLKSSLMEYYISEKLYEMNGEYSLEKMYKEVKNDVDNKKIDLNDYHYEDLQYTANIKQSMKNLIASLMYEYRREQKELGELKKVDPDFGRLIDTLSNMSNKDVERCLRKTSAEEKDSIKRLLKINGLTERKSLEKDMSDITSFARKNIKDECVHSITKCIELLDKYGFLEQYVLSANKINKNGIYLHDCDYDYDEIKKSLTPDKLKKLNIEQLIAINAFWTNRTNKVINQLNKSLYILSHKDLTKYKEVEPEKYQIIIEDEKRKNAIIKLNTIEKLCFEEFKNIEINKKNGENRVDFGEKIKKICEKYGKEYKRFFDSVLPENENDLERDLCECYLFENAIFNSYKIKNSNLEALIISILNGKSERILNYGYIPEDNKNLKNQKFVLLGIDVKGLNMPLRLHFEKDELVEIIKQMNIEGDIKLRKYKGYKDFECGSGYIPTKICVPVSNEMAKKINEESEAVTDRDRFGKTIKHLNYIINPDSGIIDCMKMPDEFVALEERKFEGEEL